MEQIYTNYDYMNVAKNKKITEKLKKDEQIVLSALVDKFNNENKVQQRILLVTDKGIYNLEEQNFFVNIFKNEIRRQISYSQINSITFSKYSKEFVIHLQPEHDYRFRCLNLRGQILATIAAYYLKTQQRKLGFYCRGDFTLSPYTTTIDDLKLKNYSKLPQGQPQFLDQNEVFALEQNQGEDEQLIYQKKDSTNYQTIQQKKISMHDFELISVLGKGAFGKVVLCRKKDDQKLYAIKQLRKQYLIEQDVTKSIQNERIIMEKVDHPFLIKLKYAFQTEEKIFFIMDFVRGGDLFFHLDKLRTLTEIHAKFYAGQLLLAFEYLSQNNIVYRDLKPENILIEEDGYIKLSDYGIAKILNNGQTNSFSGTSSYIAPEVIQSAQYGCEVDIWALGILIYEMLIGITPWFNQNDAILFNLILNTPLIFKKNISNEAKDLLTRMLEKDRNKRLKDIQEIKKHPWFNGLNFQLLEQKKIQPPYVPQISEIKSNGEISNFDESFTSQDPMRESILTYDKQLVEQNQVEFMRMTYDPNRK